jgi:hypothetical protein
VLGEVAAQRCRHVGHRIVGLDAAREPGPDLPCAVARLAAVGEGAIEEREVHAATVAAAVHELRR